MARKVRCQITGEYGKSDTFYKVNINGTNKYYKNKDIYDQHNKELVDKEDCFECIADLIYDGVFVPPVFKKIINKMSDNYSYEVITATIKDSQSSIEYALRSKNFTHEYGKAKYISKIIENNI